MLFISIIYLQHTLMYKRIIIYLAVHADSCYGKGDGIDRDPWQLE